jgi:hypothetical protein
MRHPSTGGPVGREVTTLTPSRGVPVAEERGRGRGQLESAVLTVLHTSATALTAPTTDTSPSPPWPSR